MCIEKKFEFYKDWMDKHKAGEKFFPIMSKLYQEAELKLKIVKNIPENLPELKSQIENESFDEYTYLTGSIKQAEYDKNFNINTLQMFAATGSLKTQNTISGYQPDDENESVDWKHQISEWVLESQNSNEKISEISNNIGKIWSKLKGEFDETVNKFESFKHNLISQVELGILMRNVLEHIYGRMEEAAREIAKSKYEKLNKNLKWARMSDFVAKNGRDSQEYEELVELHGYYSSFKVELTNCLKNNRTCTKEEMKEMYAQFIELLYAVLLTLDIEKIKKVLQ